MQLSKLLGLPVVDAGSHPVGTVIDVRLTISGDPERNPPAPHVLGLVISPHARSSFLGYERSTADAPAILAALVRWRHRGAFVAVWDDVARVGSDRVTLRPSFTRYAPALNDAGV
jgi:hypothetical protein